MQEQERWPDGTPKSLENAFTLGALGRPHGYVRGSAVADTPKPAQQHRRGGFGANNGTIPGMRDSRAFTIHTRAKQRA